ncbi:MAG: hypothetical protein ACPG9K_01045 [Poseidonibacter sp.]
MTTEEIENLALLECFRCAIGEKFILALEAYKLNLNRVIKFSKEMKGEGFSNKEYLDYYITEYFPYRRDEAMRIYDSIIKDNDSNCSDKSVSFDVEKGWKLK